MMFVGHAFPPQVFGYFRDRARAGTVGATDPGRVSFAVARLRRPNAGVGRSRRSPDRSGRYGGCRRCRRASQPAARTRPAGAPVYREMVLEKAQFARRLTVIPQGRPAGGDRLARTLRGSPAASRTARPQAMDRGGPLRRQPGAEQAFGRVDVAHAGDDRLVEQGRLDRRRPAGEPAGQPGGGERVAERVGGEAGSASDAVQRHRGRQVHKAEASRIAEADDRAGLA